MKTGLVLEGGAMRGIYTAGVLDVFLEQGIHFDGVIGVLQEHSMVAPLYPGKKEEAFVISKNIGMINIL